MKSAEDVESYLLRMGVAYESVNPGMWLVKIDGPPLVVSIAGPVVAFRLKVMDLPASGREPLYRTLLGLNTTEMVHGAFGLEGEAVVVVHALELENPFRPQRIPGSRSMTCRWPAAKHQPSLALFRGPFFEQAAPPPASSGQSPMGIFSRLGTLIKSNLNDLISKA